MKTLLFLLFGALCAPMFGHSLIKENKNIQALANPETFFAETGDVLNYGALHSPLEYQYQDGITFSTKEGSSEILLSKDSSKWVSGESKESSYVDGSLYNPGKNVLIYTWTAPKAGTYTVKGLFYNHYAFTSEEDLSGYNVSPRAAQSSQTRDGVIISASFTSSLKTNYSGNYETLTLTEDFKLFVNKTYFCFAGDSLKIYINGNSDFTEDDVSVYMGINYSTPVTSFDFTGTSSLVYDELGTTNSVCTNPGAVVKSDPEKGVHFGNTAADDNLKFYFDPNFTNTDFTDYLTEFSIHVRFTIEGESNDWAYIFSTTSHENQPGTDYYQYTKGIALGLNSMGTREAGTNKLLYSLQLRIDQKGDPWFFGCTQGWINDLVDGQTYDAYINVSTSAKLVECFCTGTYNGGWAGTNASGSQTMEVEDTWTMFNPGYHGLTLGCFNEAGENQLHGWMSKFEVFDNFYEYHKNTTVGPFREPSIFPVSVDSVEALSPIDYQPTTTELLIEAPDQIALTLSNSTVKNDSITWNPNPVCVVDEYYLVGITNTKYPGKAQTVKLPINGVVITLVKDLKYQSIVVYAPGASNELPSTNGGIRFKYYTDKELTNEFTAQTFTVSTKLYISLEYIAYNINYVLDGGVNNEANPETYTIKDTSIYLYEPNREGYTFDGWYLEDTFETEITEIDCSSLSDITVYAKWTEIKKNPHKPDTDKKTDNNNNTIIIVSAACGGVVLVAAVATIVIIVKRKKAK